MWLYRCRGSHVGGLVGHEYKPNALGVRIVLGVIGHLVYGRVGRAVLAGVFRHL